ncbi:MAG: hypothetical protein DRP67_04115 [Candidatus Omnitrophota bacterium]|nr:MAG: hypothetical protein DRP67_04115 [Candidatus Omnitrophota bacterium]HDN97676.1 hypothetical protein [bacterium]
MPLDLKGKEILKEVNYEKVREAIIDSILKRISREGTQGCDLRLIIEKTLQEKDFSDFIKRLVEKIREKTKMTEKESKISASYLIQEDIGNEICKDMEGEMEEVTEQKGIQEKGEKEKLWTGSKRRFLGKRAPILPDLFGIFKRHLILRITICVGFLFLIISAVLFRSFYKAILVGLTLTAFEEESLYIKIANLLGGIGGILIFFTSLSIVLQHFLLTKSRDETLREIARRFLERKVK